MQAISKPSANLMPSGPPTGVGSVYAMDCDKKNIILMGAYKPSAAFEIPNSWRSDTPKKLGGPEARYPAILVLHEGSLHVYD